MQRVRIAEIRDEAEGIKSFRLIAADGAALLPAAPGAHIDVVVAPGLIRQYSLCNGPGETAEYLIAVKREPASRGGSAALHERLAPGDILEVGEPRNNFPLAPEARRSILLAGGIGITPLLAMAKHLQAAGGDYMLHCYARAPANAAFRALLEAPPFGGRCTFHLGVAPADVPALLEATLAPFAPGTHVFICGPSPFMAAAQSIAAAAGWPADHVHVEYFGAAPIADPGPPFEVELAQSGLCVVVRPDETILSALRAAGISMASSCEQGDCGTCAVPLLDGEADHRDHVLSEDEKADGTIILPCVSRARSARLVIDL